MHTVPGYANAPVLELHSIGHITIDHYRTAIIPVSEFPALAARRRRGQAISPTVAVTVSKCGDRYSLLRAEPHQDMQLADLPNVQADRYPVTPWSRPLVSYSNHL
jgi:hypothetical protein